MRIPQASSWLVAVAGFLLIPCSYGADGVDEVTGPATEPAPVATEGASAAPSGNEPQPEPPSPARLPRSRYWLAAGPALASTSPYAFSTTLYPGKSYGGLAVSAGLESLLGDERRVPLGIRLLLPWLNETSSGALGYGAGRVSRLALLPGVGFAVLPGKLEVMLHAGLSYMKGESPDFDAKIGVTPGVTIAWQLSPAEEGTLYQAVELGAFRVEETRGSADLGIGAGICAAVGTMFGGTTPDPTCTKGIAPAAYVFTLMYRIGGQ